MDNHYAASEKYLPREEPSAALPTAAWGALLLFLCACIARRGLIFPLCHVAAVVPGPELVLGCHYLAGAGHLLAAVPVCSVICKTNANAFPRKASHWGYPGER